MQGGAILSVAFSHDASLLAASCWDKSVAIYETITWQRIRELSGHTGTASFVGISPGKKYALNRNRTQGEVGVCAVPSCGPGSAQARPATFVGCVALPPCCYLKSQLWKFFDALELCCNCENLVKKKLDDVSGGTNFFSHQAGVRAQCTGTRGDFFRGRHGARDRERGRDVQGEYSLTVRKLSIRV